MSARSTTVVLRTVAVIACILHASSARSDELCAALDKPTLSLPGDPGAGGGGPARAGACGESQIEVEGDFCPWLEQTCIKRPTEMSYRCSEYKKPSGQCQTGTAHKHFCIDTYEWPNKVGENPVVMKDWYTARNTCQSIGKRLCTEDEWTLACEGPEHLPYPYGYERDATACNIDKPHITVDEKALTRLDTRQAELAKLWQGEPSGSRERCVSPFGVHDMTGNVDEWTLNETGKPHHSALKGGYWSWVRGRCRPVTPGHDEGFKYYNIGFRCCSDPNASGVSNVRVARAPAPAPAPAPSPVAVAAPAPAPAPPPPAIAAPSPKTIVGIVPTPPPAAPPPPPPPPPAPVAVVEKPAPAEKAAPPAKPFLVLQPDETHGAVAIPSTARGHRVFVDGRSYGNDPRVIVVECGKHVFKVGHDGRDQPVDVPCNARTAISFP